MRKKQQLDPRVERTRARVLSAAHRLLQAGGPRAVTYSALAHQSGVGRATIYRHWPSLDTLWPALIAEVGQQVALEPTGDLREDLTTALTLLARGFGSPEGRVRVVNLLERAQRETDARRVVEAMQANNPVRQVLERARKTGALPADLDMDIAAALLVGPILQRSLMAGTKADARVVEVAIDAFLCVRAGVSESRRG